MSGAPARILIVNQNWLGDVLFSTPAIRAIRRRYPESYLACLAPRRVREALLRNPHLNEVLVYDERAGLLSAGASLRLLGMLRKHRFDTAFFFHRSRSKVFLARLAGIGRRIGFSRKGRDWLLTQAVDPSGCPPHKIDYFLHLVNSADIASAGRAPELVPTAQDEQAAAKLLSDAGLVPGDVYAAVHPGGNWKLKRWPIGSFIRWVGLVLSETPWKVVLCGTAEEDALARAVLEAFPGGRVVSLCGRTTLGELASVLGRAAFLLSNDSGPIHVAAARGAKVLGLYGPTSPLQTGPVSESPSRVLWKDVGCEVPCYFRDCDLRSCMELLTPEEVYRQARELAG